jgi:hypothetical protein
MMGLIKKGPDVAAAAQTGDPSLVDPEVVSATGVVAKEARGALEGPGAGSGDNKLGVTVLNGPPGSNLPPASDTTVPGGTPFAKTTSSNPSVPTPANSPDPNELKPTAAPADPNELKPSDTGSDQALPPPTQVNEIQQQGQSASAADATPASDADLSSSKKHKKKGLKKINPF